MKKNEILTGCILGRFQVFHNGHLRYLTEAVQKCNFLIIGVTNPDPSRVKDTEQALHRSQESANPLTYYERMKMIQAVCEEINLQLERYDVVPAPLDVPDMLKYYIPKSATIYLTIHDQWSLEKMQRLKKEGYNVEVLINEYGIEKLSSSTIRQLIAERKDYASLVPKSVNKYLRDTNLENKIAEMFFMKREECFNLNYLQV